MDKENENIWATAAMAMRDKDKAQSAVIKLWFENVFFSHCVCCAKHIWSDETKTQEHCPTPYAYTFISINCKEMSPGLSGYGYGWLDFIVLKCIGFIFSPPPFFLLIFGIKFYPRNKKKLLQMLINCVISFAEMPFGSRCMSLYWILKWDAL